MEVLLAFLAAAFVMGARTAPDAPAPKRWMLLTATLFVCLALATHRLA